MTTAIIGRLATDPDTKQIGTHPNTHQTLKNHGIVPSPTVPALVLGTIRQVNQSQAATWRRVGE